MTDTTPRAGAPLLAANQAQKNVTHNEALYQFDALLCARFLDRDLSAPPSSPADGDTYLVKATASGAWTGQDGKIAYCADGGWRFYAPFAGLVAYVTDESDLVIFNGSAWVDYGTLIALENFPMLGVNTTADSTNRLAAKSAAILFDNVGNGTQLKLNKNASTDTASVLYQTAYSGRAEIGLCGDDNFHFKVSPDGAAWFDGLDIGKADGGIDFVASETTLASAATCDIGSSKSLRVQITGTTAITSFGTKVNKLRLVRFADALTLTHNATSLILLGGAGRTTAAGDVGIYTSDSSGNWRERDYCRAASDPGDMATKSGTQTLANKTLASPTVTGTFTSAGISDAATATVLSLGSSNTAGIGVAPTSNKGLAVGDFGASNNNFYVNTINTAAIFVPGGLTGATGENAGNAVFKVRKDSTTGRSINSAGTNNAAGADYADYYFKRDDCGPILKGQGVGFDCAGLVTDKWANAVSFGVKSTAPSYVGGDIWGTPETLGLEEPQAPEPPDDGADDATVASYNTAKAQYATDKSAFDAALEAQRQKVDRIAVAGKVPVIVSESCNPGDWIVPAQDGEGIKLIAVADSAVTFDQYRKCVGRVLVASPTETQLRILVPPDIALIAGWNAIVDVMKG